MSVTTFFKTNLFEPIWPIWKNDYLMNWTELCSYVITFIYTYNVRSYGNNEIFTSPYYLVRQSIKSHAIYPVSSFAFC